MPIKCSNCQTEIKAGEKYNLHSKVLCAACCMEIRTTSTRKTHWQYLKSIKAEVKQAATDHLNAKDANRTLSYYTKYATIASNGYLYPSFQSFAEKSQYNLLQP